MVLCCLFLESEFRKRFTLREFIIYFSSVWVAEWPPFGKELLTRLTICSLCILTICNFSFGFEGWIWVLIASVPGLCIRFTLLTNLSPSFGTRR